MFLPTQPYAEPQCNKWTGRQLLESPPPPVPVAIVSGATHQSSQTNQLFATVDALTAWPNPDWLLDYYIGHNQM